jgi:hypothetical protein
MPTSTSSSPGSLQLWAVTCGAMLPVSAVWAYKVLVHPRPFWIHYYDPELAYFFQGQRLRLGFVPTHTDSPGTPVQILTAAIQSIWRIDTLEVERFLLVGYVCALVATVLAVRLLVGTVLRGVAPLLQIATVWTYFLVPSVLDRFNVWSPELWAFPFGTLAIVVLWWALGRSFGRVPIALGGATVGLACAVKMTFAPWIVGAAVAVTLAVRRSDAIHWAGSLGALGLGVLVGFVMGTLPIIQGYPRMLAWLGGLASHQGVHGQGPPGFPQWGTLAGNLTTLVQSSKMWHVVALIGTVGPVLLARKAKVSPTPREWSLLGFSVAAALSGYLLTLKHYSPHYLLPVGLSVTAGWAVLSRTYVQRSHPFGKVVIFCGLGALLLKGSLLDVESHRKRISESLALRESVEALFQHSRDDRPPVVAYGWRFPHPAFALRFAADGPFVQDIDRQFPREGMYTVWSGEFWLPAGVSCWDYLIVSHESVRRNPEKSGWIARSDRLVTGVAGYYVIASTTGMARYGPRGSAAGSGMGPPPVPAPTVPDCGRTPTASVPDSYYSSSGTRTRCAPAPERGAGRSRPRALPGRPVGNWAEFASSKAMPVVDERGNVYPPRPWGRLDVVMERPTPTPPTCPDTSPRTGR